MKLSVQAATQFDHQPTEWEVKKFAGLNAGICYMPGNLQELMSEDIGKTLARAEGALESGHHSVYDHTFVTLGLEGVPKILAMTLNNEHAYTTSEKSARYTTMAAQSTERALYMKWQLILRGVIAMRMPGLPRKKVRKLALENARYFISVFTPATTMHYTCSIRQINYIANWIRKLYERYPLEYGSRGESGSWPELWPEHEYDGPETDFEWQLVRVLKEFYHQLQAVPGLLIPGLVDNKFRGFSLLTEWRKERLLEAAVESGFVGDRLRALVTEEDPEEWGARGYSTNYWGSMAQLAQAQRHRTLHCEMRIPNLEKAEFYVPPMLQGQLVEEWLTDMKRVKCSYPQGMLVRINESGRLEDLVQKCQERLCWETQLEICKQTAETARSYYTASMWNGGKWFNPFVAAVLQPYVYTDGCKRVKLSGAKCSQPCWWILNGHEIKERFA